MGEKQKRRFQFSFNASLRVDFQCSRFSPHCGLIVVLELEERLGFGELAAECLTGTRAKSAQLSIVDLLRQPVYSCLAGYEDVNDAKGNRNVVVDQLAAAAGEDRRTVGKACPLLLAIVGGEPPDAAPVWKQTAADRGFATASGVGSAGRRNQSGRRKGVEGAVSEKSLRNGANHGLFFLAKALPGASGSLALERMQITIAAAATGSMLSPQGKQNGNPVSNCIE
jgi:hypothetical protein